jgi:hypothetical protein
MPPKSGAHTVSSLSLSLEYGRSPSRLKTGGAARVRIGVELTRSSSARWARGSRSRKAMGWLQRATGQSLPIAPPTGRSKVSSI